VSISWKDPSTAVQMASDQTQLKLYSIKPQSNSSSPTFNERQRLEPKTNNAAGKMTLSYSATIHIDSDMINKATKSQNPIASLAAIMSKSAIELIVAIVMALLVSPNYLIL
jgi:hypothetical protein